MPILSARQSGCLSRHCWDPSAIYNARHNINRWNASQWLVMALLLSRKNYFTHNNCIVRWVNTVSGGVMLWSFVSRPGCLATSQIASQMFATNNVWELHFSPFSCRFTRVVFSSHVWLRMTSLTSDLSEAPDLTASLSRLSCMRPSGPRVTQPLLSPSSLHPLSDIEAGSLMTPNKRASFLIIWVNYSNKRIPILVKLPHMI